MKILLFIIAVSVDGCNCKHEKTIGTIAAGAFIVTILVLVLHAMEFGKTKAP